MEDPKALEAEIITAEAWAERNLHQSNRFCFMVEGRGGEERCSSRTRTGASTVVSYGGRAGWKRTVFFSHTYRSQYFRMVEGRGGECWAGSL
jgi:hypothetical protein